jgi:hypothetical protein
MCYPHGPVNIELNRSSPRTPAPPLSIWASSPSHLSHPPLRTSLDRAPALLPLPLPLVSVLRSTAMPQRRRWAADPLPLPYLFLELPRTLPILIPLSIWCRTPLLGDSDLSSIRPPYTSDQRLHPSHEVDHGVPQEVGDVALSLPVPSANPGGAYSHWRWALRPRRGGRSRRRWCFWLPPVTHRRGLISALHLEIDGMVMIRPP